MKRLRHPHGFTLIELIVVILILGILATIAVVGYTNITNKAQDTVALANAKQIVNSLAADVANSGEGSVDGFLAKEALYGPDGVSGGGDDYTDATAYLAARFPGVTAAYTAASHTIVVGATGHQKTISDTDKAIPTIG